MPRRDYKELKILTSCPQRPQFKYLLERKDGRYLLAIRKPDGNSISIREISRELLSIPEQLLLNILTHQPVQDGVFELQKEYRERALFYFQAITGEVVPELSSGEIKLGYQVELAKQYARVWVDPTVSGFSALKDVPRDRLSSLEKAFISFLSGIPINTGSFFVAQHLFSKLFYFLARLEVTNMKNGQKFPVAIEELPLVLNISAEKICLQIGEKKLKDKEQILVLGDKQYVAVFANKVYPLSQAQFTVLTAFGGLHELAIPSGEIPNVLAEIIPLLDQLQLKYELSAEAKDIFKRIIIKAPSPVLEIIEGTKGSLTALLSYDYGLAERSNYFPGNPDNFYEVEVNAEKYYLKRDKPSEDWLDQFLQERRFTPKKKGYDILEDDFIDFFSFDYLGLQKNIGLKIIGDNLERFKYQDDVNFEVDVDFKEASGIDWFEFSPTYRIKNLSFTHDQIRSLLEKEKEYIRLEDGTIVKVPVKQYQFLQEYLAEKKTDTKSGKYKIKKYDIYYLYTSLRSELKSKVDDSLQRLLDSLENFKGIPEAELPGEIQGTPRNYQKEGFNWLLFLHRHAFHGILADDMGLGKTFQVLLLLAYLKQQGLKKGPSLIVAPTSVVYNWVAEVQKFTPFLKVLVLSGSKDRVLKVKEASKYDIVITSYTMLRNDLDHYAQARFYYMILDEAQIIKNYRAQVSQTVKCLHSEYRLAMTGTPIENRLSELWSIFDFLMPGFLSTISYFKTVYDADTDRLKRKIKPFILRRTKLEVLSDLPPKNEIDSYSELLPDQEQAYLAVLQAQKKEIMNLLSNQSVSQVQMNILASLLKLRQICCHPALLGGQKLVTESAKFNQFKELVEEILESGSKVVVFSQFVQMLTIIRGYFAEQDIKYAYLDGSTRDRQEVINDFNGDPKKKIFLCSLKAGGLGINLTSANYVIIYDPWWNPAVEQQAMDRVYRMGQQKEVFVYKLITKGTVEEKILKLQEKKRSLIDAVVVSEGVTAKSITKEDLEELFSY